MTRMSKVLYVGGLPQDTHESEVIRLFDDMPGYLSCNMIVSRMGNKCVAFVAFETIDDAEGALQEKEGLEFPPGNRLTVQFGKEKKEDSRREDKREDRREEKREDRRETRHDDRRGDRDMDRRERDYDRKEDRRDSRRETGGGGGGRVDSSSMGPYARRYKQWLRDNTGDTRSSGSVFIRGLPRDTTEREVMHLVRPFAGFTSVRVIPKPEFCFAFADFETELIAKFCADTLDGYEFERGRPISAEMAREKRRN